MDQAEMFRNWAAQQSGHWTRAAEHLKSGECNCKELRF